MRGHSDHRLLRMTKQGCHGAQYLWCAQTAVALHPTPRQTCLSFVCRVEMVLVSLDVVLHLLRAGPGSVCVGVVSHCTVPSLPSYRWTRLICHAVLCFSSVFEVSAGLFCCALDSIHVYSTDVWIFRAIPLLLDSPTSFVVRSPPSHD